MLALVTKNWRLPWGFGMNKLIVDSVYLPSVEEGLYSWVAQIYISY